MILVFFSNLNVSVIQREPDTWSKREEMNQSFSRVDEQGAGSHGGTVLTHMLDEGMTAQPVPP